MKVNLQVKKIIALSLVWALIIFVGYGMLVDKAVPAEYMAISTLVVGFYFGKGSFEREKGPE